MEIFFVDLSLFVLLYDTSFLKKFKNFIDWTYFIICQITPLSTQRKCCSTYIRGREWFVGLSILLFYGTIQWNHFGNPNLTYKKIVQFCAYSPFYNCTYIVYTVVQSCHRRRMETEGKAKVIAAVWGQNLFNSLPR